MVCRASVAVRVVVPDVAGLLTPVTDLLGGGLPGVGGGAGGLPDAAGLLAPISALPTLLTNNPLSGLLQP